MDTVKTPTPSPALPLATGVTPETREALDAFFRSFGFTTDDDLSRLAAWVLGTRGALARDAVALAREQMEAWLAGALGLASTGGGSLLARGRAAFVLCEGVRWGAGVLTAAPSALPAELARALRAALPVPAPRELPTTMPEQQLVLWPLGELFRRWWRAGEPDVSISR
ncbi:hypothetical protein [Vitiosangium sp. GDMCC 1.1324]|uniref:hypothetical protein n=1 Tax=Vitiosangium sp. (strain GDMCC 1.1324) TaxID=2138576 RepID=UPI000D3C9F9F|nr:hypothetical protein [Vitiosangium sp. GDMCC 1.1324]PTL75845.1 hypothetical protein DAT35_52080 [Vitiosangium sp. GDMCC 1.1324]